MGAPVGLMDQQNVFGQEHPRFLSQIQAAQAQQMQNIYKIKPTKRKGIMKLFRDYLEAHRDTIFTLILILLADHYVFNGAFADTIRDAFKKLLDKAHQKIDAIPGAKHE